MEKACNNKWVLSCYNVDSWAVDNKNGSKTVELVVESCGDVYCMLVEQQECIQD